MSFDTIIIGGYGKNKSSPIKRRHQMDTHSELFRMSCQDLNKKRIQGENFVLVDTLTDEHFKSVHIPGARNACVFEVAFLKNVGEIVPGKEDAIIVYGSSAKSMDSLTAMEKLIRAGYRNVSVLEGGLASWRENDYPLEGTHIEMSATPEAGVRLENGTFRVDTGQSVVEWTGRNPNKKHHGTIPLMKGEMTVGEEGIAGSFELDMTGIKNIDLEGDEWQPVLLSHLMSDDFFFVKMFPKAFFNINSMAPIDASSLSTPNYEVAGDLELRGHVGEICFPATITPMPGIGMTIEAHFDIDRTLWKAIYGSARFFEHLGMHLVFDLISIQMRLALIKAGK